ncbi:cytochrome c peroxidase [Bremerella sp. P1]|uniref:cytochrome c peroxidase n=1 Tax=Bremerella sp. P1 TaxID=3026424 RepID=UPI0023678088|nr:cytochrome c peroxidase [Bremerella sp. P1]WDI43876.1 cytochrome c peroxidase [Bremerella sp. P1]
MNLRHLMYLGIALCALSVPVLAVPGPPRTAEYRSPVDVVLLKNDTWLVVANQTSNSVSLIETESGKVLDELPCSDHPTAIAACLDGQHVLVSCAYSGHISLIQVDGGKLREIQSIEVGFEPTGLAVAPDGKTAYVGLVATGEVAQLDLEQAQVARKFSVGAWPRYLAVSPNGERLAVGCSGESKIVIVDLTKGEVAFSSKLSGGINIGHMQCSADGKYVYFPWMIYRSNPINRDNIRRGWVLGSRIGRVRLDKQEYREAITLDVPGMAVADPHGIAMNGSNERLVVSASGSHDLLIYRKDDLPWEGVGGPGDLIDPKLMQDRDLFKRIDLGGRPMGMAMAQDGRTVYVTNYLREEIQVVDIDESRVVRHIPLGKRPGPSQVRHGEELFYDARRSLDQWYSCHTCHYNGGVNSKAMDTWNDGSALTMKTVLPLEHLDKTGPWTWHGWQEDIRDAMHKSFTTTMQGRPASPREADAILAYLKTDRSPPNPFREKDGSMSAAANRGQQVFESAEANCASCHSGRYFTDGKIHDVGLGSEEDEYVGYNTPSLTGIYRKVRFLHDGRAGSLEDVLMDYHSPEEVSGTRPLTDSELTDLISYLKSL